MNIAFTLNMPNCGSWNGKWTGEGRLYCIVKNFKGKKHEAKAQELLDAGSWYYSWGDGWGAAINAKKVDGKESARLRRKSRGFCGYDWMVDTIIKYGKPMNSLEVKKHLEEAEGVE